MVALGNEWDRLTWSRLLTASQFNLIGLVFETIGRKKLIKLWYLGGAESKNFTFGRGTNLRVNKVCSVEV